MQFFQADAVTKLYCVSAVLIGIYMYLKFFVYNYWKLNNVPHDPPTIPFGNILPVITGKLSLGEIVKKSYEKFKHHRFHGFYLFNKPILMINDPELIKVVLIKEFNKFPDRGLYFNEKLDPINAHLFFLGGEKWRRLRAKLTPTFTSGKLKQMYPYLKEVADQLIKTSNRMIEKDNVVDVKELISRYTNDTICSVAYGFNCNCLENPNDEFRRHGSMVFSQNRIKNAIGMFAPKILDFLRIPFSNPQISNFFISTFSESITARKERNIVRNDFLNLLMPLIDDDKAAGEISTGKVNEEKISMLLAAAQAFVFFVAGFETSSSTVTYALYELAKHPEIQRKLQKEIDETLESEGSITYEKLLNGMPYLHMVFSETLRKHPSVPFLNRICVEDFTIPETNFCVKKGTAVIISPKGLQDDPQYFPEPENFDPERFSKENVAERNPYVYLPFGDGPRNCIGNRFGIVQSKMALASLLSEFDFSVCEKTKIPIPYSKKTAVQAPECAVYLRIERRHL